MVEIKHVKGNLRDKYAIYIYLPPIHGLPHALQKQSETQEHIALKKLNRQLSLLF